jgi:hypothetical protein
VQQVRKDSAFPALGGAWRPPAAVGAWCKLAAVTWGQG